MVFVFDQCLFSGRETNSCLVDMRNVFFQFDEIDCRGLVWVVMCEKIWMILTCSIA